MPKLDKKIALLTGGTSGIGLAAAKALVNEGAFVYITGRRERELTTAVQEIGRTATGVRGDVSNADDLDRLFEQITRRNQLGGGVLWESFLFNVAMNAARPCSEQAQNALSSGSGEGCPRYEWSRTLLPPSAGDFAHEILLNAEPC